MSFNIVSLNFICRLERISSLHGHAGRGGKEDLHVRLRKKVLWWSHYPLHMWTLYQTSVWIVVWDRVRGLHWWQTQSVKLIHKKHLMSLALLTLTCV